MAALPRDTAFQRYHLLHAVTGQLLQEAGRPAEAAQALRRALELATVLAERELLAERLADVAGPDD